MRLPSSCFQQLAPICLLMLAILGCGSEPALESASGRVTLDDKPLGDGTIEFMPEGGKGLAVGALIQEGMYRLPNPPGLAPGRYRVSISARGGSAVRAGTQPDLDLGRPGVKDPIPARYNEQTTLHADVTAQGSNDFPFDLSSKSDSTAAKIGTSGNPR